MLKWSTTPDKNGHWQRIKIKEEFFDNSSEESVTDKSHYRPDAPAFARVQGSSRVGLYDFVDGIDTGLDLSPLRRRGIDETEIQACIDRLKNLSDDQIHSLKETAALSVLEESKKMEAEKLKASKEASKSSPEASATSSSS